MKKLKPLPFFLLSTSMLFLSCGKYDLELRGPQFSNSKFMTNVSNLKLKKDFRGVYRTFDGEEEDNFLF